MTHQPALALVDGRYEIVGELGHGGLGVALRARDRARAGALIAFKVVRELGDAARALLEAEFRALARLAHPAVPPVHDVGVVGRVEVLAAPGPLLASLRHGAPFVTRALVEGADLWTATRGRAWSEVRPLVVGLARALGAIHARGLVHGDLKPGNVLVPDEPGDWPVRLIDLGPGETVEYLAPERLRGAPLDRRADLFALGATLYRVLAGELPFAGRTTGEVARAVLAGQRAPLAARAPDLPPEVAAAVERLLEPVPARRWRSAAAFLRALGEPAAAGEDRAVVPSLAAAPLVGRAVEVEAIARALDLRAGHARVVLALGGPGSGKSRWLAEAALEARLRGLRVAVSAGPTSGAPFGAFLAALPELAALGPRPGESTGDPGAALRALDALAGHVLAAAAARPLALVLDDLDRAGAEDRALAALLARRLARGEPPLVLFATASAAHDLGLGLEVTTLSLGDVPGAALPDLVRAALGPVAQGEAALLGEVARRAGGNPGLVDATLRDLAARGALVAGPAGAAYDPAAALGDGAAASGSPSATPVAALVEPAARGVALALVALGRPASIGVVARTAGLTPEDALAAFAQLAEAGLAVTTDGRLGLAAGRLAPDAFSPDERRRATAAAAAALLARLPTAPGGPPVEPEPGEVGRLLARAGDAAAAVPHLLEAARAARAASALGTAQAIFGEALAAALAGGGASPRFEALRGLGEALLAAGAAREAAARLAEAVALASDGERARLLLLLAQAEADRGDPGAALARLAEARAAAAPDLARADLLEGTLHLGRGDLAAAELALRRALAAAPDARLRATVLGELAGVAFRRAAPREAVELLVEAGRVHRAAGDPRGRALNHARLGHATEALGDRAAARRHHRRAIRLFKAAGDRAGLSSAWGNLANLLRNEGDLTAAARLYTRVARLKLELGVLASRASALTNLGQVRLLQGRPRRALRALRQASAAARATGEETTLLQADTYRAEALAALGRCDAAERLARSIARREVERPQTYGQARSEWAHGHVLLARGDARGAVEHLRRAEQGLAKAGHPIDLVRVHEVLVGAYRRLAGLPEARAARPDAGPDRAELEALRAQSAQRARLVQAVTALASSVESSPARLLERVCEDALALLGAERAFVVVRGEGGRLDFAASRNLEGEAILRPDAKAPHALLEAVLAQGRTIASADALRDGRLRELTSVQLLDVRAVLAVPLRDPHGGTMGALYADNRLRPGGFEPEAVAAIEAVAALAASALTRARLAAALDARTAEADALRAALDAPDASPGPGPLDAPRAAGEPFAALVGDSPPLRAVLEVAARVAPSDVPALILGESGTGKELLARAIHLASARRAGPFVAESCAALPDALLESDLFGHVRGAFTGADRDRVGLFAQAHGGTLFLDEVGDTSPALQAKLLRTLQEGEVRPVGAEQSQRVDVRVIAATNRDLEAMRLAGTFRDDLFFRLGGVTLRLPPLRDRADDVLALAERFLSAAARRQGRRPLRLEPAAAALLRAHAWPGNVRELEHVLRGAALFAERGRIGPAALRAAGLAEPAAAPPDAGASHDGAAAPLPATHAALQAELDARERAFFRRALEAHGENRARAAAAVGLSRYAFNRTLRRLGLSS